MAKIDVTERIKRAETIVHQLEGLDSGDKAVVKILQQLIETIEPIDCSNPNFVKLRGAVDEIILYHKKSALESGELHQDSRDDFGPAKLISAAEEQKK